MSLQIFCIMLVAALLHSVWNAIVKGGKEKVFEATLKTMGAGLCVLPMLFVLPVPPLNAWPFILVSVGIHSAYYSLLGIAYKHTDMSYAYTVMRGTAPLITALMMTLVMGVALSLGGWSGVLLLSTGILLLAVDAGRRGHFSAWGTFIALGNAFVIMGYTLADGFGARASGVPVSYVCWLMFGNAFPMMLIMNARYGKYFRDYVRQRWQHGLAGGLCSLLAYGATVWAMAQAPIALIAALRETSVVFGLLLAVVFLKERVTLLRVLAIALVAGGSIVMKVFG